MSTDMYPQGAVDLMTGQGLPYDPDEFERAADEILARPKPRRAGNILAPPVPTPSRPRATGLKKVIRRAVRNRGSVWLKSGGINAITNDVHKAVRARLARAWDDGFEAGADHVSGCCGCSGLGDPPTNPYTGEKVDDL